MLQRLIAAGLLAIVPVLAHAGTPMSAEAVIAAAREGVTFVDNEHIEARLAANPDLMLLDVRTESEFATAHIPGASWMARGVAEFRLAETVRDGDTEIVIYCATGSRAALLKKALERQGYTNVSAHEGFDSWAGAGLPVSNAYGIFTLQEKHPKK